MAMVAYAVTIGIISQKAADANNRKLSVFLKIFGGTAAIIVGIMWIVISFS